MHPQSRVWVYQADRFLQENEIAFLNHSLEQFTQEWAAHGAALSAQFDIIENLFIILAVDETSVAASGCSIDSSTRFIKSLEQELGFALTNRLNVACIIEEDLKTLSLTNLKAGIANRTIYATDLYFDNAITSLEKLRNEWIKPFSSGWTSKLFQSIEIQE